MNTTDSPVSSRPHSARAVSRRKFLRLAGGGVVLAAGVVALGRISRDPMPDAAVSAWRDPGATETDPRRRALAFALLAPNPHNRQPWLVDLPGEDDIVLYCDRERLLPHTDPFSRQILIGHGAFLELLALAAAAEGRTAVITLFPEGEFGAAVDERPVAHVRLVRDPATTADPLFAHVLERRSHKDPFDLARPVSAALMTRLAAESRLAGAGGGVETHFTVEADALPPLRRIASDAIRLECATPRTLKESIDLLRVGGDEIAAHRDGISLHGPMFWWMKRLGMMSRESTLDPTSAAHRGTVDSLCANPDSAMGFVWMTTAANRRADQIAAGRAHVRLNLAATRAGVQLHPLSQALQEFPEMDALRAAINTKLGVPTGHTLQMLSRVGYAPPVGPSPRRGLRAHLI